MVGQTLSLPNRGHFPNQWLWGYPEQRCGGGCISIRAVPPRLHQASPANPPLWSADQCWQCWRGQAKAPALAPAHPAPPSPATAERARPSRHDGAGRSGRSGAPAQQCLHTHLARARTQITLIHFKPTLSPAALQQILLKPCLHNRQSRPAAALQ